MSNDLAAVLIGVSLITALWAILLAALNRPVGNPLLVALALGELLVGAQLVVALVEVIAGKHPSSTATFLAYAIGEVVVLPAGLLWSQAEKSRSSTLVIAVACFAVSVMTVRMLQMWSTVHG